VTFRYIIKHKTNILTTELSEQMPYDKGYETGKINAKRFGSTFPKGGLVVAVGFEPTKLTQ